ncbi:hypothetical protein RCL1_001069 [Eukaryota sp. TZLM3-RCL]
MNEIDTAGTKSKKFPLLSMTNVDLFAQLDVLVGEPLVAHNNLDFDQYLRGARRLLNSALDDYSAKNYQDAYIKFKRFILLVKFTLPKHKDSKTCPTALSNMNHFASKASEYLNDCCTQLLSQVQITAPTSFEPEPSANPSTFDSNAEPCAPPSCSDLTTTDFTHVAPPSDDPPVFDPSSFPSFSPQNSESNADNFPMYSTAPDAPPSYDLDAAIFGSSSPSMDCSAGGFASLYGSLLSPAQSIKTVDFFRAVHWPGELVSLFLNKVVEQASMGIEACALLCAPKSSVDVFKITHIVIPKQTGTVDSCTLLDEASLIPVIENNDLTICGWIHTHPKFDTFLSAIDLHTHLGLQLSLNESIAIVVSLLNNSTKTEVYHLSAQGINEVSKCKKGGHHEHSSNSFLVASHALKISGTVECVDLR